MPTPTPQEADILMTRLREALLHEDREEIAQLKHILDERSELAQRVDPIVEAHIKMLVDNFPRAYHKAVEKIIDTRLRQQQDELVRILYPHIGKMVREYVAQQFRVLRERIDAQINRSPLRVFKRSTATSVDEILVSASPFLIEQVFVVSHDSGLLLGSASATETVDKDMIAGMLTAIKHFMQDAFLRSDDDLHSIRYGEYELVVHNFFSHYITLAVSGTLGEQDRANLWDKINTFAEKELNVNLDAPDAQFYGHLQQQLLAHFIQRKANAAA